MSRKRDLGESPHDHGEPRVLSIYDGRNYLGYVAIGRSIRVVRPNGTEIERFARLDEARRAVIRDARGEDAS